jgi:putative ABC transport system permease protein
MSWLARLRNVFRADEVSKEIEREMAFHVAERTDELIAAGATPKAARREAERRFGSDLGQRDNTRDRDVLVWLETLLGDFRYGLRALRRSPVFAVASVLTLAIGIGANTAVFSLLHGLLLRSLPVPDPQDLARIGLTGIADAPPAFVLPYRMIQQLRREQRSFVDLSVWREGSITLPDPDGTLRHFQAALVSGNAFDVLAARPRRGRLINASDDVRGGPSYGWPVVLSDGFWRDRFGADPRVLGTSLVVSGTPVTIVGVAPPSFHGVWPGVEPQLYLPLNYLTVLQNGRDDLNSPTSESSVFCAVIGRLKPGVSHAAANVEIAAYQKRLLQEFAPKDFLRNPRFANVRLLVESARTGLPTFFGRTYSAPLFLMQGLVGLVLVLCCVNVSGLMMSKLHERQHEFAVRTAIGAGRVRLVRQYLAESFVIALAGAALGAAIAWHGTSLLLPFFRHPNMGTGLSVPPDHTVFAVSAGLAVLTTLAFGMWPAWSAGGSNPGGVLKSRLAAQRRRSGQGFVAMQLALSVVLVVSATLLSRSLVRLRGEPTGFDLDHVTIQTPPFNRLPQKGAAKLDVYQRMVDRIGQGKGVQSAAVTWFTPMTGSQVTAKFQALGDGTKSPDEATLAYNAVGPGYFRTMQTAIIAGREFETRERSTEVCVLNQAAASFLFPGQAAVDRYVRAVTSPTNRGPLAQPVTCRVVGVAEDAKFASLNEPPPRTIYFPVTGDVADGNLVFLLNGPTKAGVIAAYSDALREIAPAIPLVLFATLREQMDAALGSQRAFTFLSTFFAGVALLLSAIGLYGMLSSSVTQRTGEIGIRAALGASRGVILRMVFGDALRLVAVGVGLGTLGLLFASGPIRHMLYGVSVFDVSTLAATAGLLALVVLIATFWPARRAASVDPMRAMRAE